MRFYNDIAVFELEKPFDESPNIDIIPLPPKESEVAPGTIGIATGWGLTKEEKDEMERNGRKNILRTPPVLQMVKIPVLEAAMCARGFRAGPWNDNQMCAGYPEGGRDACQVKTYRKVQF